MKKLLDTVETQPAESAAAEEVVEWGLERFGDRIAISTSFQASGYGAARHGGPHLPRQGSGFHS